jgi:hypothetical protein
VSVQDPVARSLIARAAIATRWARLSPEERTAATQAGRDARLEQFARQADPEGRLSPADRLAAAEQLRHAHMLRMSLAAKRARARRKVEASSSPPVTETVPKPIPLHRRRRPARVEAGG